MLPARGRPAFAGRDLAETDCINVAIREILDVTTEDWDVVTLVELKDIQLPDSMKPAMARQADAERESAPSDGRSGVITVGPV
jgi:regulator of protease activity HflC (stomatin/prohibitin superfamily)